MSPGPADLIAREADALRRIARAMQAAAADLGSASGVARAFEDKADRLLDCAASRDHETGEEI